MKHGWGIRFCFATLLLAQCIGDAQTAAQPAIVFASVRQGEKLLTRRDDFVARLSPFDRSARMKTDRAISEREYLQFVRSTVRPWTKAERAEVESAWNALQPKLAQLRLPWPKTIYFVKTTGAEEGGQEYTRATEIVLPESALSAERQSVLKATIAHELFHVLSRNAPELRDKLYAVIGFQPCGEIELPAAISPIKLTDPDAPKTDHCIQVQTTNGPSWAVPILFSKSAHYDTDKGGVFFQYAQFKLLVVQRADSSPNAAAHYDPTHVQLLDLAQVQGFYEQVGRNTNYIIHPEEILADNFRLLLLETRDVPSPEILQRLSDVLKGAAKQPNSTP